MSKPLDYREIANSHPSLSRGMVWCRTCGRAERIDAAYALQYTWPKCCGYTMTIDHPSTWGRTALASSNVETGEVER